MKYTIIPFLVLLVICFSCHSDRRDARPYSKFAATRGKADCCKRPSDVLTCKLTTPEMDARKATVLNSLRKQVLEKEELDNGYAFKFAGNDHMIDELTEFAKTERHCCDFFTFNLSITGDTSEIWFEITGPPEAKEFISTELEL